MDLYQQIFFTTLALTFGLLHLILYLYNRQLKSNLYFALFALFYAGNIFFDFQTFITPDSENRLFYLRIHRVVMSYNPIFALLFLYSLFESRIPKQFWLISMGLIITGIFGMFDPINNLNYILIFIIAFLIESVRLISTGISQKKEGAWIIAVGFVLLFLFSSYDLFVDLGIMRSIYDINNGYPFGFAGLIVSMSVYLASDFAKTNEKMLRKERQAKELELQRRLLEAEDERKSRELEEARKLQYAMLPPCVNEINGLDICLDMKAATEVGGDYYDYNVTEDGTLTIAIGDATGHGMRAGIMVSIIKSLFITHAGETDIPLFFEKCSRTIKQMRLGNLFMAFMLVRIKDSKMIVSSAGMPPLYIYRAKTKTIEDVVIKGMPLGAVDSFPYQTTEAELSSGDTVLLMSDGLAELFNENDEMLDYPRISELFKDVADKSPAQIIQHLYSAGDKWRNSRQQGDDITLIVFKAR